MIFIRTSQFPMDLTKDSVIKLLVTLAYFWLWSHCPPVVLSAPQTCRPESARCIYDTLNLSSDGLRRLRASAREHLETYQIEVQRLITPHSDGVLLNIVSAFANKIVYNRYHESVFNIPPTSRLIQITLESAPQLETITAVAPNKYLTTLNVKQARFRRIPDSFRNLRELGYVTFVDTSLETVSLEPFVNCPNITTLLVSSNKIRFLEASPNAELVIPLTDLVLSNNQLESIDGAFFAPLTQLRYLNLESNRIQRVVGRPISLPQIRYVTLADNQLLTLNFTRWHVPEMVEIFLERNNLTRIPVGMERLSKVVTLVLPYNKLFAADLRRLEGWNHLIKIDLSNNRLRTVMVSGKGRLTLPNLEILELANNQLTKLDYPRWNFPKLSSLSLIYNQLTRLPNLGQLFPALRRAALFQNPLSCTTIRQWQELITSYKLSVDSIAPGRPCTWNGTVTLPSGRVYCCVA
uniref:Leucine rich immune protein (Coil-less) n=1 Tax=Anopheles farauti TaxID=69004 RepID=A0A182QBC0_9DIPT